MNYQSLTKTADFLLTHFHVTFYNEGRNSEEMMLVVHFMVLPMHCFVSRDLIQFITIKLKILSP
jgi:hypothetical protein